jgi:hypothetical protein
MKKQGLKGWAKIVCGMGGLAAITLSLGGCAGGYYGGYGPGYYGGGPDDDLFLFGGGYDRGRDVHGYSHRGYESRSAAHFGGEHGGGGHSGGGGHGGGGHGGGGGHR